MADLCRFDPILGYLSPEYFHRELLPLIRRNYRLRAAHVIPDRWFWADRIACNAGCRVNG